MKKLAPTLFVVMLVSLFITTAVYSQSGSNPLYLPIVLVSETVITPTPTPSPTATATPTSSGAYTQSGGNVSQSNKAYSTSTQDQSAVYVTNSGVYSLTNGTITKSGNSSSMDNSSFYGLNAAVLANSASTITLTDSTITSNGTGGNGAFAYGSNTKVNLTRVNINATADGGHGIMATGGGQAVLTDVNITTTGGSSSAIATDRGSGTITVNGGVVNTSGMNSAGLYSTGVITVTGTTFTSTGAESAVVEGSNSIVLNNASLTSSKANKWGVMIYQSMSGDAAGANGVFSMTDGSLSNTASSGPLFYITNTTGNLTLKNASLSAGSGILLKASAGDWGTSGSNGGNVVLTADSQILNGSLVIDNISTLTATLKNTSRLNGAINTANTAKSINLTLTDAASIWTLTADSYLTCLTDSSGISGSSVSNITGNGYSVYYNKSSCSALGGQTYSLVGGGYLKPAN